MVDRECAGMIPNRRQFVASLAGVPLLVQTASAQAPRANAGAADPVLQQILTDLRDLVAEGEAQPGARKAATRGIESNLGILAAHVSAHYDARIQGAIRRREARIGRVALVEEFVASAHKRKHHEVSREVLDEAITRISRRGVAGSLRDVQRAMRAVRLNAPDALQHATFGRIQFDYCADLQWAISLLEGIVNIACAIAILEPTVGGEIICAALLLALGMLQMQRSWFC